MQVSKSINSLFRKVPDHLILVKHLWFNDGTLHHKRDSWNLNKKLSVDCCKSGPVINPTLRLNNFKHTKKLTHSKIM